MLKNILCLTLIVLLCTCSFAAETQNEHKLGRGDHIRINVLDEPEVTKETVIGDDGYISLALIDRIKLEGMTCAEAAEAIRNALKEYIVQPEVSVELIAVGKKRVFVAGEVQKRGVLMLEPNARLMEALAGAEYLNTADLSNITIQRKSQIINTDLTLFLSGKDLTPNILLEDGDTIIVPRQNLADAVLVLGAVNKAGTTALKPGMTIREAIAAAGGVTPDADTSKITLKHDASQEAIPIDYERAMAGDPTADLTVSAGDTIFVPKLDDAYFVIQGGVKNPGRYSLKGRMTIEEATAEAGGLTKDAKIDQIEVVHTSGGIVRSEKVNLDKIRKGQSPVVVIQPGDSIIIPTRRTSPDFLQILSVLGSLGWILVR
ncbi:MAG: SLBB domain-containing protein [Armatimonadota bacterium]|nr:SLBB domain-containing protein [Armatimonadota bacterium]